MGLTNLFLIGKYAVVWKKWLLSTFILNRALNAFWVLDNSASLSSLVHLLSTITENCGFMRQTAEQRVKENIC